VSLGKKENRGRYSEPQNQRQPNISASLLGRAAQIDKASHKLTEILKIRASLRKQAHHSPIASHSIRENLTHEVSQNRSENLYKERAAVYKKPKRI